MMRAFRVLCLLAVIAVATGFVFTLATVEEMAGVSAVPFQSAGTP